MMPKAALSRPSRPGSSVSRRRRAPPPPSAATSRPACSASTSRGRRTDRRRADGERWTEIAVYNTIDFSAGKQNCGTTPTAAKRDTIAVADTEPGTSNRTLLTVSLGGGPFVNSDATGEGTGTKEIEITYDGGEEARTIFSTAPRTGG